MSYRLPPSEALQEAQNVLSYQIDIKMGEASITEQSRLRAIRAGSLPTMAGHRLARADADACGSQE